MLLAAHSIPRYKHRHSDSGRVERTWGCGEGQQGPPLKQSRGRGVARRLPVVKVYTKLSWDGARRTALLRERVRAAGAGVFGGAFSPGTNHACGTLH